ncbi:MAG TPA: efflux RND transporter periplasmic adaptor subunit [Xanthobacteraceae bacterium]|nr:efflux RND transporter periplasmic adaptor subunit [Xanthobacteraceae bacterium]
MRARFALVLPLFLALFPATPAASHEGHDHDEAPRTAVPIAPRGEAHSGDFALVAVVRERELVIYLDRFATNEPVRGAQIEALVPGGNEAAAAHEDGTYRLPAKWIDGSKDHYDLIFTVTADGVSEILPVTIVVAPVAQENTARDRNVSLWLAGLGAMGAALAAFLAGMLFSRRTATRTTAAILAFAFLLHAVPAQSHEGHSHDEKEKPVQGARDVSQRLPDGSVFVPKSVQRLLEIRTAIVKQGEHARTIELPGRVIPDANASGYVQSSLAGRLLPPPDGFPALGSRVEKGQVLAYVEPPIQAIDISDMRQKEGELLQQIAIVERRVMRFEKLVESNAVARTQLEDARTELEGLRARKAQLDKIRREPEVLLAPVSGIIAEANTVAGQLAQPSTVVFQIVDPARLWVEALSFEAIPKVESASARAANGKTVDLTFRGSAAVLRNQSIAVHFAINGKPEDIWAGQFVTVFASLPEKRRGIRLPRAALIRTANGQYVVFEHISAERFEARAVKADVLDADSVIITAGIEDGKRIVVLGAELLDQVR